MSNSLFISDLHLTDTPRDDYRWKLFSWLPGVLQKHRVRQLFILGDLTDAKDYHSSRLVNRVADSLLKVREDGKLSDVWILRGNHDGLDPECPYFRFLGKYPAIHYISAPYMKPFDGNEVLMLPHTRDPLKDWQHVELERADFVFMHATVTGSFSENGMALEGIPATALFRARKARIFSGDVHVPQKAGRVEYVGCPYPVRFGDTFTPRALLMEDWKKTTDLIPPTIKRRTITVESTGASSKELQGLSKGDQIKVRVKLQPSEYGDWQRCKDATLSACAKLGIEVCGIELQREEQKPTPRIQRRVVVVQKRPQQILADFCEKKKVDKDIEAAGSHILNRVVGK